MNWYVRNSNVDKYVPISTHFKFSHLGRYAFKCRLCVEFVNGTQRYLDRERGLVF